MGNGPRHKTLSGSNAHPVYRKVFSDAIARSADIGPYTVDDIADGGIKAIQLDTSVEYRLTTTVPTWTQVLAGVASVSHASTTGQAADDHHSEAHTVASHSDTIATGANLDELTGGGTTTLHTHGATVGSPTLVTSTPYMVLASDTILLMGVGSGIVNLITVAAHISKCLSIIDIVPKATANPITINSNGAETILGNTNLLLDRDNVAIDLVAYGTNWSAR